MASSGLPQPQKCFDEMYWNLKLSNEVLFNKLLATQPAYTCSKSTMQTPE